MAKVKLYSVQEADLVSWDLDVDQNGEIVATHGDETLKFPGNVTKAQLNTLFDKHNKANAGVVARSEEEVANEEAQLEKTKKMLASL